MPRCKYCNQLNKVADSFQDHEHPSYSFCSKEHWELYKKEKKVAKKKSPVPIKPKSDLRKLTDYIQIIWPVEPNWQWFNKQIKNLCTETGLTQNDIRLTLKYCIEVKELQADGQYGLQQFIPKYCQEAQQFINDIQIFKFILVTIDFEDELVSVPVGRVNVHRQLKEDMEFNSN